MIRLGVNIDHVATLRQARGGLEPSVLEAAKTAVQNGADGITVHLREDRRHIQDQDVIEIKQNISTQLNLEMSIAKNIVSLALEVNPDQVTIVPEKREELTTEGGLDVVGGFEALSQAIKPLQEKKIPISLFIDPEFEQIDATQKLGCEYIELHTGEYANAVTDENKKKELHRLIQSAEYASKKGLIVNAGHGLNYENVQAICRLPALHELNIGHSIISRAVFDGLGRAVARMKEILSKSYE